MSGQTDEELTGTLLDYRQGGPLDKNAPAFHPGWRPAEHERGVRYTAPWEDPFGGFPEHARRCAQALADTGLAVQLRSINATRQIDYGFGLHAAETRMLMDRYADLLGCTLQKCLVEITQAVVLDVDLQNLVTHHFLDPKEVEFINQYKILSTVFERDRVSKHAAACLNKLGQVWVANPTDLGMLVRCGVQQEKLRVVPIPHFPDDPLLGCKPAKRAAGPVRFYHIGKWEPRKAQHEMIGAFLQAFEPGEAKLYLKTSSSSPDFAPYPKDPAASLRYWRDEIGVSASRMSSDIFLITQMLPIEKIRHLHALCDVYVSLSRGEGFDMPAYDAKLAGNRLLYTPTGGPSSFAAADDFRVAAEGSVKAHRWYGWDDAEYLDWPLELAIEGFRRAKAAVQSGEPRKPHDLECMSAATVGTKMKQYIDELLGV